MDAEPQVDERLLELLKQYDERQQSLELPSLSERGLGEFQAAESCVDYLANLRNLCEKESVALNVASEMEQAFVLPESLVDMELDFGRFEIVKTIGTGGFSTVFLARDPHLDRQVALKVLSPGLLGRFDASTRFEREALAAATVSHCRIVPVFETGTIGPLRYLAYKFCEGGSLADWIHEGHELDFRAAAELISNVADGLQHMHQRGIVHRDIKPSNLLVARERKGSTPSEIADSIQIGDLGLMKSEFMSDLNLTHTGELIGTPAYMSPEQVNGDKNIGPATDIFSLGVVFFQLLCGKSPFRKDSHIATFNAIKNEDVTFSGELSQGIPRDLQAIVFRCLEKNRDNRYGSAKELSTDIHRWIGGYPVSARVPKPYEIVARWCRRNLPLSIALAFAVFSLILGLGLSVWQWNRAIINLEVADRQAHRAIDHLNRTERAIDGLLNDFAEQLVRIPKTSALRKELLERALNFQQEIVELEIENPTVQQRVVESFARMASIQLTLGESSDAMHSVQSGLEIADELANSPNASVRSLNDIRLKLLKIKSQVLLSRDQHQAAVASIQQATSVLELQPQSIAKIIELRELLFLKIRTLAECGSLDEAKIYLQQVVVLANDDDVHAGPDLAKSLNEIGIAQKKSGKFREAESTFRFVIDLHRAMVGKVSEIQELRMSEAASNNNLGNTLAAQRRWQEALPFHQKALETMKKLVNDAPNIEHYQASLISMYVALGVDFKNLHEPDKAILAYQSALDVTHVGDERSGLLLRLNQAKCLNNLGGLYLGPKRNLEKAEDAFRRSSELTNKVDLGTETNGALTNEIRYSNSFAYERMAKIAIVKEDRLAMSFSDVATRVAKQLVNQNPTDIRFRKNLVITLKQRAKIGIRFGHPVKALTAIKQLADLQTGLQESVSLVLILDQLAFTQQTADLLGPKEKKDGEIQRRVLLSSLVDRSIRHDGFKLMEPNKQTQVRQIWQNLKSTEPLFSDPTENSLEK